MSAATASPPREITPEEFERMPDAHRWELIDGRLVERNLSSYNSSVGLHVLSLIAGHEPGAPMGGADFGLQCFPDRPQNVRFASGCFYRPRPRTPVPPIGWARIAPDLVVDVVHPDDGATQLLGKVLDYLQAGVRLVWVLYPRMGAVVIHRADMTGLTLIGDAVLTGEDVLPGFAVPIAALFPTFDSTAIDTSDLEAPVSSDS